MNKIKLLKTNAAVVLLAIMLFVFACRPAEPADLDAGSATEDAATVQVIECNADPIDGDVDILQAEDLQALRGVSSISGYLYIYAPTLREISDLDCLRDVGGNLVIANNPALISLRGLSSLERIGGKLYLDTNDSLIDLHGLENIQRLSLHLEILTNARLQNVDGLEALKDIFGVMHIYGNPQLLNLHGLSSLREVAMGMHIRENHSLPTCEAQAIWDQLTEAGWHHQDQSVITGNDDNGQCE